MDRLKSNDMGCRLLQHNMAKRGTVIMKKGDQPEEFYINLNGNIGVFIPRPKDQIQREVDAISWIKTSTNDVLGTSREALEFL